MPLHHDIDSGRVTSDGEPRWQALRYHPAARRWTAKIDGFEVWGHNRALDQERYQEVSGFGRIAEARTFIKTILKEAGAVI